MVVASIVLIVASCLVLVTGIAGGYDFLVVASIALSASSGACIAILLYRQGQEDSGPLPATPAAPAPPVIDARDSAETQVIPAVSVTEESVMVERPVAGEHRLPSGRSTLDEPTVALPIVAMFPEETETKDPPGQETPPRESSNPPAELPSENAALQESVDTEKPKEDSGKPSEEEIDINSLMTSDDDYDDPPDEPAAELLLASETKRLAAMETEVHVIDGRPRFHVAGCEHLKERGSQKLPVSEAVELEFTPCSMCSAATTLLL